LTLFRFELFPQKDIDRKAALKIGEIDNKILRSVSYSVHVIKIV
jgi:hypothetical protein